MKTTKIFGVLLSIVVLATVCIGLVACNTDTVAPQEKTLIVGTTMIVDSLNRLDANGGKAGYNFDKIASTVSQISAVSVIDGYYVGVDCDFTVSDDKKTVTLTQRDGYKWHDGKSVSIDDVEYTLSALKEGDDYQSVIKENDSLIYSVDMSDAFLKKVASETLKPKHLFEGKTKETLSDEESVVGAGPFKYVGRNINAGTITFEKFAEYPKADSVKFDKVIFKNYGSQEVLALALKNGEVDLIFDYANGLSTDAVAALSGNDNVQIISQATKQIDKVMFFNNGKMTDSKVKRAIALSIDFEKIRNTFAPADAVPSREGFVAEGIFGYKETPIWSRNLQEAKELLSAKGYSASNKFRFEILVRSGSDDTQYADLLKTQIEETGLVDVVLIEKGADWKEYYQAGNHMASFAKITAGGYDFDTGYGSRYLLAAYTRFCDIKPNPVAHGQVEVEDADGELNEFGIILDSMKKAASENALKKAVEKYQDYIAENVLCVPFFYSKINYGASAKLSGFKLDSASGILNVVTFETLERA